MHSPGTSEILIQKSTKLFDLKLRELLEFRDLLWLLVRRDFVAKYKQTVLGPLWFILQPLLTTLVFTVIFGNVAKLPTDGVPPLLFYLCGLLGWNYFAQTFATISGTFTTNAPLFSKVYFPRLIMPVAAAISNTLSFTLNLGIFFAFWIYFQTHGTELPAFSLMSLILIPVILIHAALISFACGLWMTSLTAKYRDLSHLSAFLVQLGLYATPVIYPLSHISEQWRWLAALNPMATVVESFRILLVGKGTLSPEMLISSVVVTVVLLATALLMFNQTERTFIDTV